MCGRFTITVELAEFEEELGIGDFPADFTPRYNVAPTQPVAVVRDLLTRRVEWMRWGLIPSWAKDPAIGTHMINARAETLLEKPSFREAFLKRRCLLLADGFYEWQKFPAKQPSIPHYFSLNDHKPFAFAGLWESWKPAGAEAILSCTIITCAANALIGQIHERMPVILDASSAWRWLSPASSNELQQMLVPYPAESMNGYAVSALVNHPGIESPDLLAKA